MRYISNIRRAFTISAVLLFAQNIHSQERKDSSITELHFGGYIKADFLNTWYQNGDVPNTSPLRDFHLPSQIPVGATDENFDLDYHIKESRFNFDVKSQLFGKEIHGFIELDFLLSGSGDEKVSNSFNPRIRHAYFEWDRMLIGQTWSTFMIVTVPDEIDFSGALDGLVFIRQPQVRYKAGKWWFAIENPETTISPYQVSEIVVTDSEILPDVIARRNFISKNVEWGIAAIARTLHLRDSVETTSMGFGFTAGGKIRLGKRGDDVRMMLTYGQGLGRYLSAGFVSSSVLSDDGKLIAISTRNGYIAYNHFWMENKLSSSFSIAAFEAVYDKSITGELSNKVSYSLSGNLKWDPAPVLRIGVEYAYAYRELLNGFNGAFHRIQFAAKYVFGYHNISADEKR